MPAASSSPCNAMFRSKGEITPPWGVPSSVGASPLPGSNTPAFSQSRIRSLAGNDPISASRWSWPILSNAPARSASRIHVRLALPRRVVNRYSIASWQPRPGRNPYDRASNRASPGSPGESHPRAPTDPDVNLSIHPAPAVQLFRPCNATTSARTSQAPASGPHSTMLLLVCRCVPAACTSSSPSASDGDPCACRSGSPRSGRTR